VSTNPFLCRAIEAEIGTLVVDFNTVAAPGAPSVLYVATRSWAEKNRAAVQEFRQAFVEAVDFVNDAKNREPLAAHHRAMHAAAAADHLRIAKAAIVIGLQHHAAAARHFWQFA
jgi:ABC-type nitrate/sulfonate/bicarbonate transport system substrate-binding protein